MSSRHDIAHFAEDGAVPAFEGARFPFVNTPLPSWHYLTCVYAIPGQWHLPPGQPTAAELAAIASFHDHQLDRYSTLWRRRMSEYGPFDVDDSATCTFQKYPHGGWGFGRRSWTQGPPIVPTPNEEPATLHAVMDRYHGAYKGSEPSERWQQWKADHPDVSGALPLTVTP